MTNASAASAPQAESFIDAVGTRHAPVASARIVSLVPSITELLCDLGLSASIVGRTGFCVHPAHFVRSIPKVGGTKNVDVEALRRCKPSHVIVNIDENRKPVVDEIARFVPSVVVTHPLVVADNLPLYRLLGGIFMRPDQTRELCRRFEAAHDRLAGHDWPARRVLYLIWKNPWMTVSANTYIADMLAQVGWRAATIDAPDRYPQVQLDEIAPSVDAILLSSEPYRFREADRTRMARRFAHARVLLIDGAYISWYGSRAIAGLEYLERVATAYST